MFPHAQLAHAGVIGHRRCQEWRLPALLAVVVEDLADRAEVRCLLRQSLFDGALQRTGPVLFEQTMQVGG